MSDSWKEDGKLWLKWEECRIGIVRMERLKKGDAQEYKGSGLSVKGTVSSQEEFMKAYRKTTISWPSSNIIGELNTWDMKEGGEYRKF